MLDFLGKWKTQAEAVTLFVVLMAVAVLAVPILRDNPDLPKLYNLDTKQQVFQKSVSETFVIAVLVAGIIPLLWLASKSAAAPIARRRSILEVWKDITEPERIKMRLPNILDKRFSQEAMLYAQDDTYSILRYPIYDEGRFCYIVLDMKEDWKKRATTPIYSFAMTNIGVDRAKNLLGKKGEPLGKFISQAETVGLSPEDLRSRLLQRQIELERQRREQPITGGQNEEQSI